MTALEQRLAQAQEQLNSSRRQLLQAILDNADDNHFLSSRSLAKRYEVDKATIVETGPERSRLARYPLAARK